MLQGLSTAAWIAPCNVMLQTPPTLTSPSGLFSAMLPHTTTQPFFCGPAASPFLPPSFPPHDLKMSRARYAAIVPDHLHDDLMLLYSHVYTSCSRSSQISHSWVWFRCSACSSSPGLHFPPSRTQSLATRFSSSRPKTSAQHTHIGQ